MFRFIASLRTDPDTADMAKKCTKMTMLCFCRNPKKDNIAGSVVATTAKKTVTTKT